MVMGPGSVAPAWIALDVGGANIKVAHGAGAAHTVPFEVWKRPDELADKIAAIAATMPSSDCAAVTMTAELCDCYPTKAIGVDAVLDAFLEGLPARLIAVWGVDGAFHSVQEIRVQPMLAAAANWIALATVAAPGSGPARIVDRCRHDHNRSDPPKCGPCDGAGKERHRTAPDWRAGVCRRAPYAGLRTGHRSPPPGSRHGIGGRDLRFNA